MRKVFENRSPAHRDTVRVVRLYTGGIRVVFNGDRDSWTRYVIIPRRLILKEIRKLTKDRCFLYGRLTLFDLLPEGAADLLRPEHYGDAGCAFAHMPHKVKSSRKFIVIYQSGGFDI